MKRWWLLLLRIIIGGVFVWAGVLKAMDPAAFAEAIEGYQLLPHTASVAIALYLPWLEIVCGVALLAGRLNTGGSATLTILLLIFIVALLSAWWRGLDVACGCFNGTTDTGDYLWPILRDMALLVGLLILSLPHWSVQSLNTQTQLESNAG